MPTGQQRGIADLELANYIAGFVDGEGSFHVAVQRNPSTKTSWQLVPEFHVSQHVSSKRVLDLVRDTLNCGYVKPNHRQNPSDETYVYVVRSRTDLITKVIPFFREFPLRTSKREDLEIFSEVVLRMQRGDHRNRNGLAELLVLAFSMNRSGRYRRISLDEVTSSLEFSDALRRTPEP